MGIANGYTHNHRHSTSPKEGKQAHTLNIPRLRLPGRLLQMRRELVELLAIWKLSTNPKETDVLLLGD